MDLIFQAPFLLVLAYCAWRDWKAMEVPDMAVGALWCLLMLAPQPTASFALAGGLFGAGLLFNSLWGAYCRTAYPFSWADLIGIPPAVGALHPLNPLLLALAFAPGLLICATLKRGKEAPVFFVLAMGYFVYLTVA